MAVLSVLFSGFSNVDLHFHSLLELFALDGVVYVLLLLKAISVTSWGYTHLVVIQFVLVL